MSEALSLQPGQLVPFGERQRGDNMQSLAAGGLAELTPEGIQAVPHLFRRIDDRRKGHVRPGIQIEYKAARDSGCLGWQFHG